MKKTGLTREQSKKIDKITIDRYGIPGIVLMENAGRFITDVLLKYKPHGKIFVVCGEGNNGGDGFVVARYLANLDYKVHIILVSDPEKIRGDAKINYDISMKFNIPITIISGEEIQEMESIISDADWLIDALFGTGLRGEVKEPFSKAINIMNKSNKKILSIDIPSGLDCDTGEPLGVSIKATVTVSMVGFKLGFFNLKALEYLGDIHIADIGIPRMLLREMMPQGY
jgi:NAD(P)H-hydrate epimerase